MKVIPWKYLVLLLSLLLVAAILFHLFIRLGPYNSVVEEYVRTSKNTKADDIELCVTCRKRISYGNGGWRYRFAIVVTENGEEKIVGVDFRKDSIAGRNLIEFGDQTNQDTR